MYYDIYTSPFCDIIIVGDEDGITHLHLDTGKGKRKFVIDKSWIKNKDFFVSLKKQLDGYFIGKNIEFDIKINPKGTEFQKKVWNELRKIPYGELRSYKQVAESLASPKSARAVGMANSKNPIPLIIPCHRVIAQNGKLTGFAHGLEIKEQLINHEKNI